MGVEPKSVPKQASQRISHSHHLTKHSTHTPQPPNVTPSSPSSHIQSPAKKSTKHKSKPGMEHIQTVPPPLPPRAHKLTPPKSAATTCTSRQPLPGNSQESLHRVANHPHVPAGVREESEEQEDDGWEKDKVRIADNTYAETPTHDQSMFTEII